MTLTQNLPNENIAISIASKMFDIPVLSATRFGTSDMHYVYAIECKGKQYVLRLTKPEYKKSFEAAIYWQKKLLPLGVPLAEFIVIDIDGKFSPFPALLMRRLPGNDLCNIYNTLTLEEKKHLASEIVEIQRLTAKLPEATGFGFTESYKTELKHKSWYHFLITNL